MANVAEAIQYKMMSPTTTVTTPEIENVNSSNVIIPFQPTFDDEEVPDFCSVSVLNKMEKDDAQKNNNSVAVPS